MGNLTNNKIRTYYIYGSFYEHDGLTNLAMCIRLSKATKLCQMPMLINLNPQREDAYWGENGLTIPLQYFVIVTAYSKTAIGNMSILLFKKHIIFFKHYKLNKYTYLTQMLTMI